MSQTSSLRFRLVVSVVVGAVLATGSAPSAFASRDDRPYNESDSVREPWPHFAASYVTDYPDQLPRLVSGRAEALPPADPLTQDTSSTRIRRALRLDYLNHVEPETHADRRFRGTTLVYAHSRSDRPQRLKKLKYPAIRFTRVNDVSVAVTTLSRGDAGAYIKKRLAPRGVMRPHSRIGRVRFFVPVPIPNDPQLNKVNRHQITAMLTRGTTVAEVTTWDGTRTKQRRVAARAVRVAVKTPVGDIFQAHQQWLLDYAAEVSAWTIVEANNRKLPGGSDSYRFFDRVFRTLTTVPESEWKPMIDRMFPTLQSVQLSATAAGYLEVRPAVGNGRTVCIQMDTDPNDGESRRRYTGMATDVVYGPCPPAASYQAD